MVSFVILLLIAIVLTEITWKWFERFSKNTHYIWIGMGGGWSAMLSRTYLPEQGQFHWQQFMIAFVAVLVFMTLHALYQRLRGKTSKA